MDTWLLLLFIIFISLVIADHFLTYEGVIRRGLPEFMPCTKQLMEKYGKEKGLKVSSLIKVGFGIIFLVVVFAMRLIRPEFQLSGAIAFAILDILFLCIVIRNCQNLYKQRANK